MLRDERLQKVVAEVDGAPDRERVRRRWHLQACSARWGWQLSAPGCCLGPAVLHKCLEGTLRIAGGNPPPLHRLISASLRRRCCERCRLPTSKSLRTR